MWDMNSYAKTAHPRQTHQARNRKIGDTQSGGGGVTLAAKIGGKGAAKKGVWASLQRVRKQRRLCVRKLKTLLAK